MGRAREGRKRCTGRMFMRDVWTLALMNVKHPVVHRPTVGEQVEATKESKEPWKVRPLDKTISVRSEGTAVQMCGERKVAER